MDIMSILVPCGKDLRSSAGLETAIAVARLTGGRITGLHGPTEPAIHRSLVAGRRKLRTSS